MRLLLIGLILALGACVSTPPAHHTALISAPSVGKVSKDLHDAKDAMGRARVSSVKVGDYQRRIEAKTVILLEHWK